MPITRVGLDSSLELQQIADTLAKSRKVVVLTGAGISTNCGIPDFRSEDGLYSLIQAQFDDAIKNSSPNEFKPSRTEDRPKKKRRQWYYEVVAPDGSVVDIIDEDVTKPRSLEIDGPHYLFSESTDSLASGTPSTQLKTKPCSSRSQSYESVLTSNADRREDLSRMNFAASKILCTVCSRANNYNSSKKSASKENDGAQPRLSLISQSGCMTCASLAESSPLQSNIRPGRSHINKGKKRKKKLDAHENKPQTLEPKASHKTMSDSSSKLQSKSRSSSSSIPTSLKLKGRDLFDAMIWSDPFKTSIFYMFISSFRERIKSIKSTSETHHFLRELRDSGRLVRTYTQNIDCLEEKEGLSTDLNLGPGNRARFSSRKKKSFPNENVSQGSDHFRGVETVLLHGSLSALRCGLCSRLCNWDEDGRSAIISIGSAPDCPHCIANSSKRKDTGRRALTVGRLRPDIVLYGEEHPNSSLISPLVTHDLKLCPDILLVMGTSLKVHGLKVIVKEFAKAVHSKGGKVVFVNKTGPPESIWANIIDYWVDWDCDEWVLDLKERKSDLWPSQRAANDDESKINTQGFTQPDTKAKNPTETLEDKNNGAYFLSRILDCLAKETLDTQNFNGKKFQRRSFNSYTDKFVAFTKQEKSLFLPKDAWPETAKEPLQSLFQESENGLKRKAQADTIECPKSIRSYLFNDWRKFFSEAIVADAGFLRSLTVTVPPLLRQPVSELLTIYHNYIPSFLQQVTVSYGYSSIPIRNPSFLAREILRQYTPRAKKNYKSSNSSQGKLLERNTILSSDVENMLDLNKPNIVSPDICDSLIIHRVSRNDLQNDDTNLGRNNY